MTQSISEQLEAGLKTLKLEQLQESLSTYLALLSKWNKAYNLTAINNPLDMVYKHILDSLALSSSIDTQTIIDVGTGPGLPGIPLALAHPDRHFTLLDSNGKKTRFLTEVKRHLPLENINIIHSRVESYLPTHKFDTVISRAFSDLKQMIQWTQHLIKPQGQWLAMKGQVPHHELENLSYVYTIQEYSVPGLNENRCAVIINNCL